MGGIIWTAAEEKYLVDNYLLIKGSDIAETLGKTNNSVSSKIARMGLVKLSPLEDANLKIQTKYPHLEFLNYRSARVNSTIRDNRCMHTWEVRPDYVKNRGIGIKCPICNPNNRKKTDESLLAEIKAKGYTEITNVDGYTLSKQYITLTYVCGHVDTTLPTDLLVKGTKSVCRVCTPQRTLAKSHDKFHAELKAIAPDLELLDQYKNDSHYLSVTNKECGHVWRINPHNFLQKQTLSQCPTCHPPIGYSRSLGELELLHWIKSKYSGKVICSNRATLEGLEIDIFLPELNLAIEYNGEYWHSDVHKDMYYHQYKANLAAEKGIKIIQIFEHEWKTKQSIVKSRLKSMMGLNQTFGARHFRVEQVPFPKYFLIDNHIQGAGNPTSINLALVMNHEIAAVMTFGTPRFNTEYQYELIRFCSLIDINIPGAASKLFKAFITLYSPKSILSYSDKCWSNGNLYKQLKFEYLKTSKPGYFYYKGTDIINRYAAQKHKLKTLFPRIYEDKLTEAEIMSKAGYGKVYNAGMDLWGYSIKE